MSIYKKDWNQCLGQALEAAQEEMELLFASRWNEKHCLPALPGNWVLIAGYSCVQDVSSDTQGAESCPSCGLLCPVLGLKCSHGQCDVEGCDYENADVVHVVCRCSEQALIIKLQKGPLCKKWCLWEQNAASRSWTPLWYLPIFGAVQRLSTVTEREINQISSD